MDFETGGATERVHGPSAHVPLLGGALRGRCRGGAEPARWQMEPRPSAGHVARRPLPRPFLRSRLRRLGPRQQGPPNSSRLEQRYCVFTCLQQPSLLGMVVPC